MISTKKLLYKTISLLGTSAPVGEVRMFAGETIPTGWLACNGAAISRTTYAKLFAALGTKYGTGDGSTTFNLPDFRNRVPIGAGSTYAIGAAGGASSVTIPTHSLTTAELPSHHHGASHRHALSSRAIYAATGSAAAVVTWGGGTSDSNYTKTNDLTTDNTGSGTAHGHGSVSTIQPYRAVYFIIRAI